MKEYRKRIADEILYRKLRAKRRLAPQSREENAVIRNLDKLA